MSDLVALLRSTGSDINAKAADEIERLTRERDEARESEKESNDIVLRMQDRLDALAVQLVALREERDEARFKFDQEVWRNHPKAVEHLVRQLVALRERLESWSRAYPGAEAQLTTRLLTDTAAAALECERRLRIEGAEAMQENGDWADADPAAVVDAAWPRDSGGAIRPGDAVEGKGIAPGTTVITVEGGNAAGKWVGAVRPVRPEADYQDALARERALADKLAEALREYVGDRPSFALAAYDKSRGKL